MHFHSIVLKEIWHRKLSSVVLIGGVAVAVALVVLFQRVRIGSREELRQTMNAIGRNLVILPEGADLDDYWRGEVGVDADRLFPQWYVGRAAKAEPQVAGHFLGSIQKRISVGGEDVILCGVMPENNPGGARSFMLEAGQIELGARAAERIEPLMVGTLLDVGYLKQGGELPVPPSLRTGPRRGPSRRPSTRPSTTPGIATAPAKADTPLPGSFKVIHVRRETGTPDDYKVYCNVDVGRKLLGVEGDGINVIEALGHVTSKQKLPKVAGQLEAVFKDAKPAVRAHHLISLARGRQRARTHNARMMNLLSIAALILGGILVAGYAVMNVRSRRKELGVFLAIVAQPGQVGRMFLLKMLVLGLLGGLLGCAVGHAAAVEWGPEVAETVLEDVWRMYAVALASGILIAILPGLGGVIIASRIDPADTLRGL
jgi:hypothetical protein